MKKTRFDKPVFARVWDSFAVAPDRACAVIGASITEEVLTELLLASITNEANKGIFAGSGCFGTFSAKIDIAQAFGIIPKCMQSELHTIRRIRNRFAHDLDPSLELSNPSHQELGNRSAIPCNVSRLERAD